MKTLGFMKLDAHVFPGERILVVNILPPYCKESYLCSIVSSKENKDSFLISYSNPHCDTFINRTIPCKLCKEKFR